MNINLSSYSVETLQTTLTGVIEKCLQNKYPGRPQDDITKAVNETVNGALGDMALLTDVEKKQRIYSVLMQYKQIG